MKINLTRILLFIIISGLFFLSIVIYSGYSMYGNQMMNNPHISSGVYVYGVGICLAIFGLTIILFFNNLNNKQLKTTKMSYDSGSNYKYPTEINEVKIPKLLYIDEVRSMVNQYLKEEISLSKLTELLNEKVTGLSAIEISKLRTLINNQ